MECSLCHGADPRPETNFCEECGAALRPLARPATQPPATPRDHHESAPAAGLAAVTDRGLRHPHNEDWAALARSDAADCLVVCDGVSRSHRPAEASAAAASAALAELTRGTMLRHAIVAAEAAVRVLGAEGTPAESTIVAARVRQRRLDLAWLGDSRAYFIGADGPAQLLTRDHSWINQEVEAGRLSEAEARTRPEASCVVRTLGGQDQPSFAHLVLPEPGWLLLCTDGWWGYQRDPALLARLFRAAERDTASGSQAPLALARLLVETARRAGGRDNITVALAHLS